MKKISFIKLNFNWVKNRFNKTKNIELNTQDKTKNSLVLDNTDKGLNIEILKYLEENQKDPSCSFERFNEGLTISQIEALETKYNGSNPFPKALRELLYLAGEYCYFLAPVPGGAERNQDFNRELMTEFLPSSTLWITRPFYVLSCYSVGDNFQFVYLDEGIEDPPYYDIDLETGEIRELYSHLSECVTYYVNRVKSGINPH